MAEEHNALKYGPNISKAAAIAAGGGYGDVGISRLSETLVCDLPLWDRNRPEWALLRGERLWAVNPSIGATVAEFSQVGIFNPTGSNLIVVVESLIGQENLVNTNTEINIGAIVAFDSTSTPNARDTRLPVLTSIRCGSFANSQAARIGSRLITVRNTGASFDVTLNVVLSPGFFLAAGPDVVNQLANYSFIGYERVAFPGELSTIV